MKKFLIILVIVIVGGFILFSLLSDKQASTPIVTSFETCAEAGYPVLESHPRQCKTPDGRTYAEEIPGEMVYSNASEDLIVVELPFPDAVTGKEFAVIGKARGVWFFEASFPIEVLDQDGNRLAIAVAQAQGEWMTNDFVPFRADIKVPETYIGPATLILHKDNPSGLEEHDASLSFQFTIEY
jgi:hypothetical protein